MTKRLLSPAATWSGRKRCGDRGWTKSLLLRISPLRFGGLCPSMAGRRALLFYHPREKQGPNHLWVLDTEIGAIEPRHGMFCHDTWH